MKEPIDASRPLRRYAVSLLPVLVRCLVLVFVAFSGFAARGQDTPWSLHTGGQGRSPSLATLARAGISDYFKSDGSLIPANDGSGRSGLRETLDDYDLVLPRSGTGSGRDLNQ